MMLRTFDKNGPWTMEPECMYRCSLYVCCYHVIFITIAVDWVYYFFLTGFITTGKTDALRKIAGLNSQVCFRKVCSVKASLSTGEPDGDQVRNIKAMYALDLSNSREE